MMWRPYDDKTARDICYNCNSPVSRRSYAYFRTALHYNADKVCSEMYEDKAFYFAIRNKTHCRLIEIAVRKEWQGQGIGKLVLFRLLSQMKVNGLYKPFAPQSLRTRKNFGFIWERRLSMSRAMTTKWN